MKIKELLATPDKWIKGSLAKDKDGVSVAGTDKSATCFCLMGAIFQCYGHWSEEDLRIRKLLDETLKVESFVNWNYDPKRTHQEVLDLVTKLDI